MKPTEEIRLVFVNKTDGDVYIKIISDDVQICDGNPGYGCASLTEALINMEKLYPKNVLNRIETLQTSHFKFPIEMKQIPQTNIK